MHSASFPLRYSLPALLAALVTGIAGASDANRLVYLDEMDPYYVSRTFPKLTTPMWVGEPDVEAVIVLSIDDMSDAAKYEGYLRPILDRLKRIDGRAPVTIFANKPDPSDPVLQQLLAEGCSIDTHTVSHPCPLLNEQGFQWASDNVHDCTTLLNQIPGNRAVAYRMPCCDSQNTPSPRFYGGIMDKTTRDGAFLTIDSSVFNITTPNDPELPRDLVLDPDGTERFRKYVPFPSFVNTIEDYPYPYVINRVLWEFPAMVPSDWEAQNLNGVNAPRSVADMQAAIDVAVAKKGVYTLVFHPHGWIENTQVVELIDHAVAKHGNKVKFLNFAEIQQRIDQHLLAGQPLRDAQGRDNGVRLLDINDDGYLDVLTGNVTTQTARIWNPNAKTWIEQPLPFRFVDADGRPSGVRLAANLDERGPVIALLPDGAQSGAWVWTREGWSELPDMAAATQSLPVAQAGHDAGVRFRDLDGDGTPELVLGATGDVYRWTDGWDRLPYALPDGVRLADADGRDLGARFVDLEPDGDADLIQSNENGGGVYLFGSKETGWSESILPAGEALPPISVNGENNGAWFHSRHLWVMNETTSKLPDLVDRRSFNDLLGTVTPEARSPEASLASMSVRPGYTVELVAAEPLVADPITLAWAPDGGLFVVEMRDYPEGLDGRGAPGSRIRLLRDDDGDGVYDRSTVYYDGMAFAAGCHPWRDGLLVACAPEIFFLKDTDGDDVADVKEVLYTGFGEGNQQHRVNGLRWGLDNWVYGANGDSSGDIESVKSDDTLSLRGRDFRFNPDTGALEGQKGQTQYGRAMDDFGNWFGCSNSNPLFHFTLKEEYARRNPHYPFPFANHTAFPHRDAFAISRLVTRFNEHYNANKFTSVCGLDLYRDTLLGEAFYGNAFIAEPVHNLILRMELTPNGATFDARRPAGEEEREFLASTDNWFRPVMLRTGPDGALWIADMYREHIEHTEYVSEVDQARFNFLNGNDKGRIYRVFPSDQRPRPIERLDAKSGPELAAMLAGPNGWVRDMAHQLIYERQDPASVAPLEAIALDASNPVARAHALNALDGLSALRDEVLAQAFEPPHPGVLAQAIRLAESRLDANPVFLDRLLALVETTEAPVAVQLAYSLGESTDPRASEALGRMLLAHAGQPHIATAALSSLNPGNAADVQDALVAYIDSDAVSSGHGLEVLAMAVRLAEAGNNVSMIAGLAEALAAPGRPGRFEAAAMILQTARSEEARVMLLGDAAGVTGLLAPLLAEARQIAADEDAPAGARISALALAGREPSQREADIALAVSLIDPRTSLDVARAAIDAVIRGAGAGGADVLLEGWTTYTHAMRGQVLGALLARPEGVEAVVAGLESGAISPRQMDAEHRQMLLTSQDAGIRARVEQVLAGLINRDRAGVIETYLAAAGMAGDPALGRPIYEERCATCHQMADVGFPVGPDLAAAGSSTFETLVTAILDPNRAVEGRYTPYTVETHDFESFSGVLAGESANSVTLINAGGVEQTVLRDNISSMTAGDQSIMPEGLEEGLTPQDFAHLIAYIRGPNQAPKTFPGNSPAVVRPGADGALELLATNAEIHGATLVYEETYRNLGYWSSTSDHAAWTVDAPAAGAYDAVMEYCSDDSAAGNTFRLEAGANVLTGTVRGTGTWDNYRTVPIGRVVLREGEQRIVFRSDGAIRGNLLDLRGIRLTPVE